MEYLNHLYRNINPKIILKEKQSFRSSKRLQGNKKRANKTRKDIIKFTERVKDVWSFKIPICYYTPDLRNYYRNYMSGNEQRSPRNRLDLKNFKNNTIK